MLFRSRAAAKPLDAAALEAEHALLTHRMLDAAEAGDAVALWLRIGIAKAADVADMNAAQVRALRSQPEGAG